MRNCVACQQGPEWACDGLRVGLQDQKTILFASVPLDEWGGSLCPKVQRSLSKAAKSGLEWRRDEAHEI